MIQLYRHGIQLAPSLKFKDMADAEYFLSVLLANDFPKKRNEFVIVWRFK